MFVFISLSSEVGMFIMHISANQVPIKDNDTDTFWGTSYPCHLQGWQKPKFPSHSRCQGSPALMPVQLFCSLASASSSLSSLIFSLSPTSHHMLQPHLSIRRYINVSSFLLPHCICLCGSSCLEPGYFLLILQDSLSIYPN